MKKLLPLLLIVALTACESSRNSSDIDTNKFRSGHTQRMFLSVPGVLIDASSRKNKPLNLNDAKQVAEALGVKLTGDKKQVLYVIAISAPTSDQGIVKREVPIRVDNIREGAHMIKQWQN